MTKRLRNHSGSLVRSTGLAVTCSVERSQQQNKRLAIAIPRMGQMKAQVRWALPGKAGARFLAESDF